MTQTMFDSKAPRILIVRLSAIGDVIHTTPVLCALRERFPEALIAWVVEERAGTLLAGHRALDRLISVPRRWLKSPKYVWALRRRLRAMRFDLTLDVNSLTKSAILAWLSGAERRIGFGNHLGRELSTWFNTELVNTSGRHVIEHNVGLLQALGIHSPPICFDLPEYEPEQTAVDESLCQAGLERGFCLINVGAGWPSKLWPAERYAAVARHVGNRWGLPTMVVWAGDAERRIAEQVVSVSEEHARLAPPTTLRELAALARRAVLFIGSDTGPLHLAAAVGTPCVGLYGPWPAERHGPYGPQHISLQERFFEGPTRARRNLSAEYMEAISEDSVCQACDQILRRDGGSAAA